MRTPRTRNPHTSRRGGALRCALRAESAAVRPRSTRVHRARPTVRGVARPRRSRVGGLCLRRGRGLLHDRLLVDLVLRHDRDRADGRGAAPRTGPPPARSSAGCAAEVSRTRFSLPRCGCSPTPPSRAFPSAACRGASSGTRSTTSPPRRAVASVGGLTFITFLAVALNAAIADLLRVRREYPLVRVSRTSRWR